MSVIHGSTHGCFRAMPFAAVAVFSVIGCPVAHEAFLTRASANDVQHELCVATAQPLVVPGDVGGNIDRMAPLVAEAARRGARLVVTSEAGICGYDLDGRGAAAAIPVDSPVLDRVTTLARDNDIVAVAGLYERDGEDIYNSAIVFYPDGRRLVQRKRALAGKEAAFARPGERRRVFFDVDGFKCGILICADTGIEGIFDELARDGCDVALILTAGGGSESIALHQTDVDKPEVRATYAAEAAQNLSADTIRQAMELDMSMVFCNQSGWVPAWAYYHGGGSSIVDRTGRVAAVIPYRKVLEHVRPDLAVGTISRRAHGTR
jgi:predicted amidohydrolase